MALRFANVDALTEIGVAMQRVVARVQRELLTTRVRVHGLLEGEARQPTQALAWHDVGNFTLCM